MPATTTVDSRLDYLAGELITGNLALFVGAGLSADAGLCSWRELVAPLARDLQIELDTHSDLLAVAQYHCNANRDNRSRINTLLRTELGRQVPSTPALKALARLPVRTIWTTNYDRLIESTLIEAGRHPDVKWDEKQIHARDQSSNVTVYKMHGDVSAAETAVLTKSDYENYHVEHAEFLNFLRAELSQKTFLFIGFGFRDHNVDYVFGRLRTLFPKVLRQHHCVMMAPEREAGETDAAFAQRCRLHRYFIDDLLRLGVDAFEIESHDQLTEFLVRLNARVLARQAVSTTDFAVEALAESITAADTAASDAGSRPEELLIALLAPHDGTLHVSAGAATVDGAAPLKTAGARVSVGDTICVMSSYPAHQRIVSPVAGELVEYLVRDHDFVRKRQTLCLLRRAGHAPGKTAFYPQRSDMEGKFYRAPGPEDSPYVRVGSLVQRGDILGLIDVQKNFHRVTADVGGIVRTINVENGGDIVKGAYLVGIETTADEAAMTHARFATLPFVVQASPGRGRFFSTRGEGRTGPLKVRGEAVHAGQPVARIQGLRQETLVLADRDGLFLEYLKGDGEPVDVGDTIVKLIPAEAIRAGKRSFRVQTAVLAGTFRAAVKAEAMVKARQVVGTINDTEVRAEQDGIVTWVTPHRRVKVNDLLFKFTG